MPPAAKRARPRQLALALGHEESLAREDFLEGPSNAAALTLVEAWPDWPGPVAMLAGPEGSGKSHLAAIWAERAGARFLAARALDTASLPEALATGALVVEDLADGLIDERTLFHLLNLAREEEAFILITVASRVDFEGHQLADLSSRLRAVPVIALEPPSDALIASVLVKHFADRQLLVDEDTIGYLLPRIERSLAATRVAAARLDRAALTRGRRITRVLAAELFREESQY